MEFLDSIKTRISTADDKELYTYFGIFGAVLFLLFGVLAFYHYRNVNWYTHEFSQLDRQRRQTRQILRDFAMVKAQQQKVEEILAQDKDFLIGDVYESILKKNNLLKRRFDESVPISGETISNKTEVQITSNLRNMSMKEVTNFLMDIAKVPQLYTKEITIKRTSGKPTVDIDITVATLESST